jgi:hypothetical protein
MSPRDYISINGVLATPSADIYTIDRLRAGYARQDMRVRDLRPLHIAAHLDLLATTFERMFGYRPSLSPAMVVAWCSELLTRNRYPAKGSCCVTALLLPTERAGRIAADLVLIGKEILLDSNYSVRPIQPSASIEHYTLTFGDLPTSAAFEANEAALMRARYRDQIEGSHVVLRTDDEGILLAAGTAPLFAVKGRSVITTSLLYGAPKSVERQLTIDAVVRAEIPLQEDILSMEMITECDELFFADYRGLTSIERIGQVRYMSLMVDQIIKAIR